MARTLVSCTILLVLCVSACTPLTAPRPRLTGRRLLHAGEHHSDTDANENASSTSYLESLEAQGVTPTERLDQVLSADASTGLSEDAVNSLMQTVQGDSVASTTANTSLTADNIIDTYGSQDRTLNATATSTAALAILACKADSACQITATGTAAASTASEEDAEANQDITWLKWTGAAVLFVEALIGLCVPFFFKLRCSYKGGWFLSALNCFAGGVFLTFGFMHLLPDAVSAAPDSVTDNFPIGYFFAALGFYILFLLQKVIAPMLGGKGHTGSQEQGRSQGCKCGSNGCSAPGGCCSSSAGFPTHQISHNPAYSVSNGHMTEPLAKGTSSVQVPCKNCGCDRDSSPETAALTAAAAPAVAVPLKSYQGIPRKPYQGMSWRSWISPLFMWAGICVHAILEGLSLGLQKDKAGAVTVLVAMVSHKWVESVALSSILVKNGGGFKEVVTCLLPFAACFFLGTGIGVGVGHDEDPWVDVVLFGLIAGAFIFVGGYELIAREFADSSNVGKSRFWRASLFLPVLVGFTLVALLQLVHG